MKYNESDNLKHIKLGDYIKKSTTNNTNLKYGEEFIVGVSNKGIFTEPKGNVAGVNLKPYKIVNNGAFVYNPSRLDLGSIAYRTDGICIVSHLYQIFYLNEEGEKIINPNYLFMYFHRKEFYREVTFRNFGSQRPEFNLKDMSEIEIKLPSMDIQQKYVDIYNAMLENQKSYETGLEDLKLVCDSYIENLRKNIGCQKIISYIKEINDKVNDSKDYSTDNIMGISSVDKCFMETRADTSNVSLNSYKIVKPREISFNPNTARMGDRIPIALNDTEQDYLVSAIYTVFSINELKLLSEYLMMWFKRSEFDRYARYHSWGSARETFTWNDLIEVEIPIPDVSIQKSIADIYTVYKERKNINEKLKLQLKEICPILIKGSLEEANL